MKMVMMEATDTVYHQFGLLSTECEGKNVYVRI